MKKNNVFIFIIILIIGIYGGNALAARTRTLILPFNIISGQQKEVLQKGISTMLRHRLSQTGEVIVPETSDLAAGEGADSKGAVALAEKYKADYAVYGSVVVIGGSVSTDAGFVDARTGKVLVTFSRIGKSEDDVIRHVSDFAQRVVAAVSGDGAAEVKTGKNGFVAGSSGMEFRSRNRWRSQKFRTPIIGLATGDVDAEAGIEVVFCDKGQVFVGNYRNGKLEMGATIENKPGEEIIGVDVADINGNGKAEIFVSNLKPDGKNFNSYVLEWDGNGFARTQTGMKWLLRCRKDFDGNGAVLMGQKHTSLTRVLNSPIFKMKWEEGAYVPDAALSLPPWVKVRGFAMGKNDGNKCYAAYAQGNKIKVFGEKGEEYAETIDQYGGGMIFLAWEDLSDRERESRLYLHPRIAFHDIDKNGTLEIVAIKNEEMAGHLFSRLRNYKGGRIEGLMLSDEALEPVWGTREIKGHVTDFAFVDMDGDGTEELVYAYTGSKGGFKKKHWSYIAVDLLH